MTGMYLGALHFESRGGIHVAHLVKEAGR